jgi:hypothetical protein
LGHQRQTLLVSDPALPALGIACSDQGLVHAGVHCGVQIFAVGFEHLVQAAGRVRRDGALGNAFLKRFQNQEHGLGRLFAQSLALGGIEFGFGQFGGLVGRGGSGV